MKYKTIALLTAVLTIVFTAEAAAKNDKPQRDDQSAQAVADSQASPGTKGNSGKADKQGDDQGSLEDQGNGTSGKGNSGIGSGQAGSTGPVAKGNAGGNSNGGNNNKAGDTASNGNKGSSGDDSGKNLPPVSTIPGNNPEAGQVSSVPDNGSSALLLSIGLLALLGVRALTRPKSSIA